MTKIGTMDNIFMDIPYHSTVEWPKGTEMEVTDGDYKDVSYGLMPGNRRIQVKVTFVPPKPESITIADSGRTVRVPKGTTVEYY